MANPQDGVELCGQVERAYDVWSKLSRKIVMDHFEQQKRIFKKKYRKYSERRFLDFYSSVSIPVEVDFICKEILPGIASGKISAEQAMDLKLNSYEFTEGLKRFKK